ncbi:hypothetical protein HGM15179_009786 [Zosterops borbonicus]|uniref:Uncharacterized protein n=1 Tax=Zosterops borbonicus TaxID=364589 RepID=A0A8K1LGN9_9PASS|nr:hypothetical protein HGM15179_014032 [Zosterops borbonicus]TRZ17337.1 hypothetical protein HGM15179_009786 [Zosterops borbonicus]
MTEVFNALFVFNIDEGLRGSHCLQVEDWDCKNYKLQSNLNLCAICCSSWIPTRSMGPDWIHLRILKELADVIAKPLSMFFEWSWESRAVSADWNTVNIVPVFKKDKKEDSRNYRPFNLTSVPSGSY